MQPNITEEDYHAWRDHPVTRWVFGAMGIIADAHKQHWLETSWGTGACSPELLLELRTREDAYRAIIDVSHSQLIETYEGAADGTPQA